uniref:CD276 antigen homolog n=1 Tax=Erpetoichthys calabaricus TaxID=27687 RepID=A0A8C4SWT3_ERPCA
MVTSAQTDLFFFYSYVDAFLFWSYQKRELDLITDTGYSKGKLFEPTTLTSPLNKLKKRKYPTKMGVVSHFGPTKYVVHCAIMLTMLTGALAVFTVSSSQREITASFHSDVVLPCFFTLSRMDNGLKYVIISWKHNNTQIEQYKLQQRKSTRKYSMFGEELEKGNASLLIRNVTFQDEGSYECEVYEVPFKSSIHIMLVVMASPVMSLIPNLVMMNQSTLLECHAWGFYPNALSFEWKRNSQPLYSQEPVNLTSNSNGTFSAVSFYNYTPVAGYDTGNISCLVKHESLGQQYVENSVQICKPNLTILPRFLSINEKQNILCKLHGCRFSNATISWKNNGILFSTTECQKVKECVSEANLPLSKENIICEAEVEGLKLKTEPALFTITGRHKPVQVSRVHHLIFSFLLFLLVLVVLFGCIYIRKKG